jgi:hypothetical protein
MFFEISKSGGNCMDVGGPGYPGFLLANLLLEKDASFIESFDLSPHLYFLELGMARGQGALENELGKLTRTAISHAIGHSKKYTAHRKSGSKSMAVAMARGLVALEERGELEDGHLLGLGNTRALRRLDLTLGRALEQKLKKKNKVDVAGATTLIRMRLRRLAFDQQVHQGLPRQQPMRGKM